MPTFFVDTTTLIYPMDPRHPEKRRKAQAWLRALRVGVALTLNRQVLNEAYWVLRRKPALRTRIDAARRYVALYREWANAPHPDLEGAWMIEDQYGVRFWDAMLLASAQRAACAYFLSEDLNDGQDYGGVKVINPFRHAPEDVLGRAPR